MLLRKMWLAILVIIMGAAGTTLSLAQNANNQDVLRKLDEIERQNADLQKKVATLENRHDGITVSGIQFNPYGRVKFDGTYDSARTAYADATSYVMPKTAAGGDEPESNFSARDSRLGVNIMAGATRGIDITGRVEIDLMEDIGTLTKYSPRLRLAYMDMAWGEGWSLRFGQDWDTYSTFHPDTVDSGTLANQGHLFGRHPQIRLTKNFKLGDSSSADIKLAVQHGRNGSNLDGDGQPDENAAATPNFQGSVVLKTKLLGQNQSLFAISGQYGREKARGSINQTYESWMIHGGVQLPLCDHFVLQGEGWTGENLDNYLGGIGQGVNTALNEEISAHGGWVQGVVKLSTRVKTGLGYGLDDPENNELTGDARTFSDRVFANVFYDLTKNVTLALEYSHMRTDYAVSGNMSNNRVQYTVQYSF